MVVISDEEEDDSKKVVRRMKQKKGMLPGGGNVISVGRNGDRREAGHLGRRKKIKQKEEEVTKHVDGQNKRKRLRIKEKKMLRESTKSSFLGQYSINKQKAVGGQPLHMFVQSDMNRRGEGEDRQNTTKLDQPRVRRIKNEEKTETDGALKSKKSHQKKMKKIRKAVKSFDFGSKTNLRAASDSVGLPSNLIEVRAPAPESTKPFMKVKKKKSSLKRVIRKKTNFMSKKESETKIRNIENTNSSIKRTKNTKRQFKNPLLSLFGNHKQRNILTEA